MCINHDWKLIEVDIHKLVLADFCVASELIAFGGVLGKMSPFQLMTMALFEAFLYALNEAIFFEVFEGIDPGGSIVTHLFGAYFGLTVTWVMVHSAKQCKTEPISHSNLFSWFGTLFFWVYWPSFNSVLAVYSGKMRAIMNTLLSLCGSSMAAAMTSALLHKAKFSIGDVLSATLAGGVAIGSNADLIFHPYGPLLIGFVSGIVATLGNNLVTPILEKKLKLFDTCGINNLHGFPGLIGAFASMIVLETMEDPNFEEYYGRTQSTQALMQLAGLGVTCGIAIIGGLIVSLLSKLKLCKLPQSLYNDNEWWDLSEVEVEEHTREVIRRRQSLRPAALNLQSTHLPDSGHNSIVQQS